MLKPYHSRLSVLIDDRRAVVYRGDTAYLSDLRASKIQQAHVGSLIPIDDKGGDRAPEFADNEISRPIKQKPQAELELEQAVEPTSQDDEADVIEVFVEDLREAVEGLHHSSRRAVARKLGGDDDINTKDADELIAAASDDELQEAARDHLGG
jgi:hypothetical protein